MRAMCVLVLVLAGCGEDRGQVIARRLHHMSNLRAIVGLVINRGDLPMKDGALDVFAFVRSGDIDRANYSLLRKHGEKVPTDEEIERGDYTNFPYERYRGSARLDFRRAIPLLWDKEPDSHGYFIVGMSDGSAFAWTKEELDRALAK